MKKSTKAVIALYSALLCSSAFAGGIEMPSRPCWDFYIGASGVAYGYEDRINSSVILVPPITSSVPIVSPVAVPGQVPINPMTQYRNIAVFGGFDVGIGVWAERGYFGVEGRYDISSISVEHMFNATHQGFSNIAGVGLTDLAAMPVAEYVYSSKLTNNAGLVAKIGYKLFRRTMYYVIAGWVTTNYKLSLRTFGTAANAVPSGTNQYFEGRVYHKRINGGTVGFGLSHLLINGLSAFAELAVSGYRIPSETKWSSRYVDVQTGAAFPPTITNGNVTSWNYYNWNLRVGLNWSFTSLM